MDLKADHCWVEVKDAVRYRLKMVLNKMDFCQRNTKRGAGAESDKYIGRLASQISVKDILKFITSPPFFGRYEGITMDDVRSKFFPTVQPNLSGKQNVQRVILHIIKIFIVEPNKFYFTKIVF